MLYLIGFMGVGKTTIGKQLALQHNLNFIDTDQEIKRTANKSILNIFQQDGE
ncbi:MAG: shikimate kinase, partial [Bacteroidota bacterium]|nr:shikimate kinase [Bacteroidota bacterium]